MSILDKAKKVLEKLLRKQGSWAKVKPYAIRIDNSPFLYENSDDLEIAERLISLLETQKLFTDPNLRLGDVARILSTNRNYLSKAISDCCQTNFCQLCNYFRVREACVIYINNPGIGKEQWMKLSGFGSVSTFSAYFSKHVGMAPVKWQKTVLQRIRKKETVDPDDYIKEFRQTLYG